MVKKGKRRKGSETIPPTKQPYHPCPSPLPLSTHTLDYNNNKLKLYFKYFNWPWKRPGGFWKIYKNSSSWCINQFMSSFAWFLVTYVTRIWFVNIARVWAVRCRLHPRKPSLGCEVSFNFNEIFILTWFTADMTTWRNRHWIATVDHIFGRRATFWTLYVHFEIRTTMCVILNKLKSCISSNFN